MVFLSYDRIVEAVTYIGACIGRERFASFCQPSEYERGKWVLCCGHGLKCIYGAATQLLVALLRQYDSSDELYSYIVQSFTRLASILLEDFAPYVAVVMPEVMRMCTSPVDVKFMDNPLDESPEYEAEKRALSSSLESLTTGVSMLSSLLNAAPALYARYVPQLTGVITDKFTFTLSEEVREQAISAAPDLVRAGVCAYEVNAYM